MQNHLPYPLYLVSACLVGLCTRFDKRVKSNNSCIELLQEATWIPVCPEQLGGLPTPREAADILGGDGDDVLQGNARVVTTSGIDVSEAFINGAYQVLAIAKSQPIEAILLKARSPSCGITSRTGVTAALLKLHGFKLREF